MKNVEAIYPLSPQQQGMLFETLAAPESGIHVEQLSYAFAGEVDTAAFEQAWQHILDRHAILRTAFVWKDRDEPLQVVLRQVKVPFQYQDWRTLSPDEQQQRLESTLHADRRQGFPLTQAPLLRLALFQLDDHRVHFVSTVHHILMDGWSLSIVFREVLSFYQLLSSGQAVSAAPSRPYRDYVTWLRQQDLSVAETFWRQTLRGIARPTPLGIPADTDDTWQKPHAEQPFHAARVTPAPAPDQPSQRTGSYGYHRTHVPETIVTALQALARQHGLTVNTVMQGVWALLLSRYSGDEDVVFGITVSGRPPDLAGIEAMVGLFINTLPLRVRVSPQASFWPWLQDIQAQNSQLRQYEHTSGGQVHQWSEMPRSLPLYESILVFENYPVDPALLRSLGLTPIEHHPAAGSEAAGAQTRYALTLLVTPGADLRIQAVHDTRRLDTANAALILAHLSTMLSEVATQREPHLATLLRQIPAAQIPHVRPLPATIPPERTDIPAAPRTPVEEQVAAIWSSLLELKQIGVQDNFFELGGHSLIATQVISRLRDAFQVDLPLHSLFEAPTVASLADRIETIRWAAHDHQARLAAARDDREVGEL